MRSTGPAAWRQGTRKGPGGHAQGVVPGRMTPAGAEAYQKVLLETGHLSMAPFATVVASFGGPGAAVEQQSYLGNLAQVKGGGLDDYWTKSEIFRCGGFRPLGIEITKRLLRRLDTARIFRWRTVGG